MLPEQVTDVPKISQDRIPQRLVDRDLRSPQLAEQLAEVPTILYFLKQPIAEQIVDIPAPGGGLHDSNPIPGSAASSAVPRGGAFQGRVFALFPRSQKKESWWNLILNPFCLERIGAITESYFDEAV